MNVTPKARGVKAKTSEWDYIILKSFCMVKITAHMNTTKQKGNQMGEDICKQQLWQGVNIESI